ncbi:Hypothetical predicted protein [Lecanosticta acicola]|uniref:AD domain-containing protein n=1 Tax=Lecanosticta acicola TaxID=111012 RepID=A0AAI8Z914_9PEZI|nr:Hypothetical predicted protein [Lecanosticta acicola]
MADSNSSNKRNSKVGTPKSGAGSPAMQPMADPLENLSRALGARIRITTAAPHSQTFEGALDNADPKLGLVFVNTRSPPPNPSTNIAAQPKDYHVTPISQIQNFQLLSPSPAGDSGDRGFANAPTAIGRVDIQKLKKREEARVKQLKEEQQNRGRGVTSEGQAIFDSLKRINIDVRWHNQEIIAYEAVIISPPYRSEDCKGQAGKIEQITRVKKVLEGERKKIREREERERKAAAPTGPRKGG